MTTVIRRPVGALAVLTVAGLLAAGCSSGPSQVGSALIVGNTSVSVDQVQRELNNVLSQPDVQKNVQAGKLDETARGIVTMHVLHPLITAAAAQHNLTLSDQDLDDAINKAGGPDKVAASLSVDPATVREMYRDYLLEIALATQNAGLAVTFDYVATDTKADAQQIATQLAADPKSIGQLINKANAQLQASGGQGLPSKQHITQALAPYLAQPDTTLPLFGTPTNTVVTFPVTFQAGQQQAPVQVTEWVAALITGRGTVGADAADQATAQVEQTPVAVLQAVGAELLQPEATRIGVRLSPRYGVWDQANMRAADDTDPNLGVEIPVHAAQP